MASTLLFLCLTGVVTSVYVSHTHQDYNSIPVDVIPEEVTNLHLEYNKIARIDWFPVYPDMEHLTLNYNLMTEFPELKNVSLVMRSLYLEGNNISYISIERLQQLTTMELLNLRYNWVSDIPDVLIPLTTLALDGNQFTSFPQLKIMSATFVFFHIESNKIQEITYEDLQHMTSVRGLYLGQSQLVNVTLPPLENLQHLDICNSLLRDWPDFNNTPSLTNIRICYCRLTSIPLKDFVDLPLVSLHLQGNDITFDKVDDICIPTLEHLKVGENDFHGFPRWTNIGCSLLQLDVDSSDISILEDSYLDPFPELIRLDISVGSLTRFPFLERNGPRLVRFAIADHKITKLEAGAIKPLSDCTEIVITDNLISTLPNLCATSLNGTATIFLAWNPFDCKGNLAQLVRAAQTVNGIKLDLSNAKCHSPPSLMDRLITDVVMDETNATLVTNEEPSSSNVFEKFGPPVGCGQPVRSLVTTRSLIECAVRCSQTSSCRLYGYKAGHCALTTSGYNFTEIYNDFVWFTTQ